MAARIQMLVMVVVLSLYFIFVASALPATDVQTKAITATAVESDIGIVSP